MTSAFQQLLDPLLERDEQQIRARIASLAESEAAGALDDAVLQFAVLAHAPSLPSRSALLAAIAARRLDLQPSQRVALLAEVAIYAAATRRPWSEPPIFEPPAPVNDTSGEAVRRAIDGGDREHAEAWLHAVHEDQQRLAEGSVAALSRNPESVLVTTACAGLLSEVDPHAVPAMLRVIATEWTTGDEPARTTPHADASAIASRLGSRYVRSGGDVFVARALLQLDAALRLTDLGATAELVQRAVDAIDVPGAEETSHANLSRRGEAPVYRLARDFGSWLLLCEAAPRLATHFPSLDFDEVIAAAEENAIHGAGYEEWSLA